MLELYRPAEMEKRLSGKLQEAVRKKIEKKEWNEKILAQKLDLLPIGVKNLLERKEWSINTSMRVAAALKINLSFNVEYV